MNQFFVAVIDGTRARFFTLEQPTLPEYESGPNLIEQECLANTVKELHGKELWANTKTGRNRGSGNKGHGYDDHRNNHLGELERSFAKEISTKIVSFTENYGSNQVSSNQVILVAEPQILGLLRESLNILAGRRLDGMGSKNLHIQELAKDLSKLKPLEIHEYLADKNMIPARKVVIR